MVLKGGVCPMVALTREASTVLVRLEQNNAIVALVGLIWYSAGKTLHCAMRVQKSVQNSSRQHQQFKAKSQEQCSQLQSQCCHNYFRVGRLCRERLTPHLSYRVTQGNTTQCYTVVHYVTLRDSVLYVTQGYTTQYAQCYTVQHRVTQCHTPCTTVYHNMI